MNEQISNKLQKVLDVLEVKLGDTDPDLEIYYEEGEEMGLTEEEIFETLATEEPEFWMFRMLSNIKDDVENKYRSGTMLTVTKTVDELIKTYESPIPLNVIPNYMGINLCAVESVTWTRQDDGQLVSLTINFIPGKDKGDE